MKRDVDFLYELGALRLLQRQWTRFHMPNVANLADHHFRVAWIALTIAAREEQPVDTAKLLKMALVHDIAESRTNDVDYIARQYVTRDENQAAIDMLSDTTFGTEMLDILQEYEERQCVEAKIVKDADNLDVDMELQEQGSTGHRLAAMWREHRTSVVKPQLFTRPAKELYEEICSTNPHNWHNNSPSNRVNGGDWSKTTEKQS